MDTGSGRRAGRDTVIMAGGGGGGDGELAVRV